MMARYYTETHILLNCNYIKEIMLNLNKISPRAAFDFDNLQSKTRTLNNEHTLPAVLLYQGVKQWRINEFLGEGLNNNLMKI